MMFKKVLSRPLVLSADELKRAAAVVELLIAVDRRMSRAAASGKRKRNQKTKDSQNIKTRQLALRLTKKSVSLVFCKDYFILNPNQSTQFFLEGMRYGRYHSFDIKRTDVCFEQS